MPEKVVLKFDKKRYRYVETKPLHSSQKVLDKDNCIIQLQVFLTPELESLILSFGEHVEVIEPSFLRKTIKQKAKKMLDQYNCAKRVHNNIKPLHPETRKANI